jgi:hypothetical protein
MAAEQDNDPTSNLGEVTERMSSLTGELREVGQYSSQVLGVIQQNTEIFKLFTNATFAFAENVRDLAIDQVVDRFRDLNTRIEGVAKSTVEVQGYLQSITGLNASALASTEYGVNTVAQKLSAATFKSVNDLAAAQITLNDGTKYSAAAFITNVEELTKDFQEAVLDDTRLFNAGVKGMSFELQKDIKITVDSLRLQSSELNEIFQKELSETGRISGEMLDKFNKTVMAAAQTSGQIPQMIAQDVAKMISDFSHFGTMTEAQMASLSVTLRNLGMDIQDVTRLSDNFSSFDKAVDTMSKLAATTGATLDTLELFELSAGGDQLGFITSLRDQLEAQGVEFENLNIMQQKQIASAFGLDARVLQRMLSDNFETIEDLSGEIEDRADRMSSEKVDSMLASMTSMAEKAKELSATEIQERITSMMAASERYAQTIEGSYKATVNVIQGVIDSMGGVRDQAFQRAEELREMLDGINKGIIDINTGRAVSAESPAATTSPPPLAPPASGPTPTGTTTVPPPPSPTSSTPSTPPPAPTPSTAPGTAPPAPSAETVPAISATQEELAKATAGGLAGTIETVTAAPPTPPASGGASSAQQPTTAASAPTSSGQLSAAAAAAPTSQTVNVVLTFRGSDEFTEVLAKNILSTGADGIDIAAGSGGGQRLRLVFSTNTSTPSPVVMSGP